MCGAQCGRMKIVVEGVGPEEDFGCRVGQRRTAVASAACIAGETAVGREGPGETRKRALRVDVKNLFDDDADDGCVVNRIDEAGNKGCQVSEAVDAAKGVMRERT